MIDRIVDFNAEGDKYVDIYESVNEVLVHLFYDIWDLEGDAIITEEFQDITNNDMHIIEAIGLGDKKKMSVIARKLKITMGSLTTSMNSLVKKGYVVRERSETDRRVVYVRLTEKGEAAFNHHKDFHEKMTEAVVASLTEEEVPVLVKCLDGLVEFFKSYRK